MNITLYGHTKKAIFKKARYTSSRTQRQRNIYCGLPIMSVVTSRIVSQEYTPLFGMGHQVLTFSTRAAPPISAFFNLICYTQQKEKKK